MFYKTKNFLACFNGYPDIVEFLLQRTTKSNLLKEIIDCTNQNDMTPLMLGNKYHGFYLLYILKNERFIACSACQLEIAKLLLNYGCNYKLLNKEGKAAFDICKYYCFKVIFF